MKRRLPILLAVLGLVGVAAAPADAASSTSSNWAGYTVTAPGTSFSDVKGSWVQPAATCPARSSSYSSFWVGLGGSSAAAQGLEQIGTSADCQSGRPVTYAWYELVPAPPVSVPLTVSAGDTISGEVSVSGTTVSFQLTDTTTGATFSKQVTVAAPDLSSAEWIAEAPAQCDSRGSRCSVLPLANFGTALFSASAATGNGHTGTISDPAWTPTSITLGSGRSSAAVPSALSTDGTAFSVAWQSAGAGTGRSPSPWSRQRPSWRWR